MLGVRRRLPVHSGAHVPQGNVRIARRNTITRGLVAGFWGGDSQNHQESLHDFVGNVAVPEVNAGNTATISMQVLGGELPAYAVDYTAGTTDGHSEVLADYWDLTGGATLLCWFVADTVTGNDFVMNIQNTITNDDRVGIRVASSVLVLESRNNSSTRTAIGSTTLSTGQLYCAVGVLNPDDGSAAAGGTLYLNGVQEADNSILRTMDVALNEFQIGHMGAALEFDGRIPCAALWTRRLSPGEIWQLWNPATRWDWIEPLERSAPRAFVAAAGGATWPHGPLGHPLSGVFRGPI